MTDRHKKITCTNCGKLIRHNKIGLCLDCFNIKQQSNNKYCKVCGKQIRTKSRTGLCVEHYNLARKKKPAVKKPRNHHSLVLCIKCGKPIDKNKTGLCVKCYLLKIAKYQANKKDEIRHANTIKTTSDRLSKNYKPSTCEKSPCGYHRWIINSDNIGTCFYCDHSERMPELREKKLGVK